MASGPPETPRETFFSAVKGGARGALESLRDVFKPGNASEAASQAGDLAHAVSHPRQSATGISNAVRITSEQAQHGEVSLPHTGAHIAGDMLGAFAATALIGGALARTARTPYLRSRHGSAIHTWSTQQVARVPPSFMPGIPRPPIARYMATRPLALGMGLAVGGLMLYGGASQRAATARQNRVDHPDQASAMAPPRLERPLSTPLSRVRSKT